MIELQNLDELSAGLRRAADLLAGGSIDGNKRRDILKALDPVRTALLSLGFDEEGSRRHVVSFLRSVTLANGIIGKRTAHRLAIRTFEEDGDAAMKWLLERRLIEDQGSEGFLLTDDGADYLEEHKAELALPPEIKRRPHGPRARSSRFGEDAAPRSQDGAPIAPEAEASPS